MNKNFFSTPQSAAIALVAPAFVGLFLFVALPFALAVVLSFSTLRLGSPLPLEWIGLEQYRRIFSDPSFIRALLNNALFALGVVPFQMLVYLPDEDRYEEMTKVSKETRTASISGTQVREEYLQSGRQLPQWFTRPEVAEILAETYPPRYRQGACIWLTGLHNAGKSTTGAVLTTLLQEYGRNVTLLDGDVVRTHFSEGLGYSKEDRDEHVRRIGFVAAEIVRHGGIAVCAAVSPYRTTRNEVRNSVGSENYIEVYVNTPLEVCESRDTKGYYARARRGDIVGFTGIDDPYEVPQHPEVTLDTVSHSAEENARQILNLLLEQGFIRGEAAEVYENQALAQ